MTHGEEGEPDKVFHRRKKCSHSGRQKHRASPTLVVDSSTSERKNRTRRECEMNKKESAEEEEEEEEGRDDEEQELELELEERRDGVVTMGDEGVDLEQEQKQKQEEDDDADGDEPHPKKHSRREKRRLARVGLSASETRTRSREERAVVKEEAEEDEKEDVEEGEFEYKLTLQGDEMLAIDDEKGKLEQEDGERYNRKHYSRREIQLGFHHVNLSVSETRTKVRRRREPTNEGMEEEGSADEENEVKLKGKRDGIDVADDGVELEEQDDEANADLSLRIVEKAKKRRKKSAESQLVKVKSIDSIPVPDVLVEDKDFVERRRIKKSSAEEVEEKQLTPRSETPEEGELQEDGDGNLVLAEELEMVDENPEEGRGEVKKKKKKDKKKRRRGGENDHQKRGRSEKQTIVKEVEDDEPDESIVMRRLLRGPRYFDPPEDQGQSCFNCGNVGHIAAACPDGPRVRPCFVCGEFGHEGRECPQKTECYVCRKIGHIAKNCPNKGSLAAIASAAAAAGREGDHVLVCLLCGHSGHEAASCNLSYDSQDLAQVQCYVCNNFGHLCCVIVVDSSPLPVSCFNCGEMGHTGTGCARSRRGDNFNNGYKERGPVSVCYKCGEEGHFARGCSKRRVGTWQPPPWPPEEQLSMGGTDFLTPRGQSRTPGSRASRWMDSQQRDNRWTPPSRGPSSRWAMNSDDRWRTEDDPSNLDTTNRDADVDNYMGPIENFVDTPREGYHGRRKKRWTKTTARGTV